MVYAIIGKVVLYVMGTLLLGAFFSAIDSDMEIFCGAWLAGISVFLWLML